MASTAVALWHRPIFSFGPTPPPSGRLIAAQRRLRETKGDVAWHVEAARQLAELSFIVVDGFLGLPSLAALAGFVRAELSSSSCSGQVNGAGQGAASLSALRSDRYTWSRVGASEDGPLEVLVRRLDRLVSSLRSVGATCDELSHGQAACAAAGLTASELAHVVWRSSDAMLSVYRAGGSRYVRHLDNVCSGGVGKRCNGRRLTLVRPPPTPNYLQGTFHGLP